MSISAATAMRIATKIAAYFAKDPNKIIKWIIIAIMLPIAMIAFLFVLPTFFYRDIPMVNDDTVQIYIDQTIAVNEKYGFDIDWMEVLALDTAMLNQNFQGVTVGHIKSAAMRFVQSHRDKDTHEVWYEQLSLSEAIEKIYGEDALRTPKKDPQKKDEPESIEPTPRDAFRYLEAIKRLYNEAQGKQYLADSVGEYYEGKIDYTKDGFVFYSQSDPRWGSVMYSVTNDLSQTIRTTACGPTAAAMVLASYGVKISPLEAAKFALANGHRTANQGTDHSYFTDIGEQYGVPMKQVGKNIEAVINELKAGHMAIASMGPGHFTSEGHYIVLAGLDDQGNIIVLDPNGGKHNGTYSAAYLMQSLKDLFVTTNPRK